MIILKKTHLKKVYEMENALAEAERERDRLSFLLGGLSHAVKEWENRKMGNLRLCSIVQKITGR